MPRSSLIAIPLSLCSLFLCSGPALAQDPPDPLAVLGQCGPDLDLEQVLLRLCQADSCDLDGKTIARSTGQQPSVLLVDAARLQVRHREGKSELRLQRAEPVEAQAPKGAEGAPHVVRIACEVRCRLQGGRITHLSGIEDLGLAPPLAAEPATEAPGEGSVREVREDTVDSEGFTTVLAGAPRRRGGPSASFDEPLPPPPPPPDPVRTAVFESTERAGEARQMKLGTLYVNGNRYAFRCGGHGSGNLPTGDYTVTAHLWERSETGYVVDGVGYSVALSDKYDARVGRTRSLLRIHPDGGVRGTLGCIGIVGDRDTQRACREDLRAELQRGGGRFTLTVR